MTLISQVDPDHDDAAHDEKVVAASDAATETVAEVVRRVAGDAARADGRAPLNEATLLSLQHRGLSGKSLWVARDESGSVVGFALASREMASPASREPVEVNLVVAPSARRGGVGRALAERVLETFAHDEVTAWSHGNHPAAARLAEALGFERTRDLWVMRRPISPDQPLPEVDLEKLAARGVVVRTFRPGQDEEAFLALNAESFAHHPEQGSMTRADLDERMAEPWFDPAGFFVAEPADAPGAEANLAVESPSLLGFHWTKVHQDDPSYGEVYVVGVSPAAQGLGLGKALTLTGLHHLRDLGLGEVILYVEADNAPAVAVYSGLGFTHADEDTDVMWTRPGSDLETQRSRP